MRAHCTADWLFLVFAACTIVLLAISEISSHGCTSGLCLTRRCRLSHDVAGIGHFFIIYVKTAFHCRYFM